MHVAVSRISAKCIDRLLMSQLSWDLLAVLFDWRIDQKGEMRIVSDVGKWLI